ncbi:MAG: DUF1080 domain-containing protein [Planctomycetota bacterium]|nr:DUF1080 domain-containing protein [Planctomycetota bacterium]
MKNLTLLLAVCLAITLSSMAPAADGVRTKKHPDSSKWQDLFTTSLDNAIFPEGIWSFEDGVLTASKDQAIWTKRPFENCIIDIEFKTADGTNSGVIVYTSDLENWIPNSVEIQIADDHSDKIKKMPPTWRCAAIFGHLAAAKSAVKKPGQWNRMTIACRGKKISVVLNGQLVTEMDMDKWTSAKKNPDGSEIPPWLSTPFNKLPTKGHIGLQGKHGDKPIYFRNLKIKTL